MSTSTETERFVFDAFARRHLEEWFEYGSAPYDWTLDTLEAFASWVETNADQLPWLASWTDLANEWEAGQ